MILPVGLLPLVLGSRRARTAAPWLLRDLEAAVLDGRHLSMDLERLARHALREVGDEREMRDSCGTTPTASPVAAGEHARAQPLPHVHATAGAGEALPC